VLLSKLLPEGLPLSLTPRSKCEPAYTLTWVERFPRPGTASRAAAFDNNAEQGSSPLQA
jgi:hypothetical protein